MARRLEVGLAGCGRLGQEVMLPLLARRPGVRVAVVADPDPTARAAARAAVPLADVVADWREAVTRPGLDAVIVTLPTPLHAEAAIAAITRGAAVYLEKPLAATLADGSAILTAWRTTPNAGPVAIGFNNRFHPHISALKAAIGDGRIGTPRLVRCTFTIARHPEGTWREASRPGGGVLLELASHHADLARFLVDSEFVEVSATRVPGQDGEKIDASGALATGVAFSGAWGSGTVDDHVVEVIGSGGAMRVSRYEDLAPVHRHPTVPRRLARMARALPTAVALRLEWARLRSPWNDPSYEAALDAFFAAAGAGTPASPGLEDGCQSLRVIAAIAESASTGRRVTLEQEPRLDDAHA